MSIELVKSFSFFRRYLNYTGGHQKVADYIQHTCCMPNTSVKLYLENRSPIEKGLFEQFKKVQYQQCYNPSEADIAFLAGMDWSEYLPFGNTEQSIVNLVQHVRHGDSKHPLFQFLKHKATRICVSKAVKDAILPYANGPCYVVKMGHEIQFSKLKKENDLYILGNKQPDLARALEQWAKKKQLKVVMHDCYVSKQAVIQSMAQSRISVTLPNKTEGFYLPGIEAMALSDWAVVPDCIANREYLISSANVTQCDHSFESCITAIENASIALSSPLSFFKRLRGKYIACSYSLSEERKQYHKILKTLSN